MTLSLSMLLIGTPNLSRAAAPLCAQVFHDDGRSAMEVLAPGLSSPHRAGLKYVLHMAGLKALIGAYERIRQGEIAGENIFEKFITALNVRLKYDEAKLAMIPKTGSLVVTANHPFGGLDGIILMSLIKKVRPDVKFLAADMLTRLPELQDSMIAVNFDNSKGGIAARKKAYEDALDHVKNGGALVLFPAGGVSQAPLSNLSKAVDSAWKSGAARTILESGATSLSVRFPGQNSRWFQLMGNIPGLRPLYLGGEIANKSESPIEVLIGEPVRKNWATEFKDVREITHFLRAQTDAL